ncbi:TonB family protein [Sphingomonas sabuli]|uniref:TonB family protein n=1 Tax=Sphingomonas sabuli TaxID=2764186 RepID=A0A7G9L208_9SPHN|nr:energy transducer TonB [Sphingomonas sabuli]QNM82657.1 TonB family protein [Sphingomonas sabuli]
MSYAQQRQIGSNRTVAIIVVALIHVLLGYVIVTGLAYNVIKQAANDLKTFDVVDEPPPPPPEEPPPPPPESRVETPPPPIVSPPPIVRTRTPPPSPVQVVREAPPPVITPRATPAPPAPPARPAPPPAPVVKAIPPRSASGDLQNLFRGDDYPEGAARDNEQGSVTVRLTVATTGRVSDCAVSSSSGSRSLDTATCRVLRSRARFTPARDSSGNPTTDNVTQRIRWVLEG